MKTSTLSWIMGAIVIFSIALWGAWVYTTPPATTAVPSFSTPVSTDTTPPPTTLPFTSTSSEGSSSPSGN